MNKKIICVVIAGLLMSTACGGGGGGSDSNTASGDGFTTGGGSAERVAIDAYVNDFIIPTLASLDSSTSVLNQAVSDLVASPDEQKLSAARAAWVAARIPWENSEAALFGPVDFYGFDPALDSWPVNRTDVDAVLNSATALNQQTVGSLDNALKGFHTIEYFLYGERGAKSAADITAREVEYLVAATASLNDVTSQLLAAWVSGIEGQRPYAEELVSAGRGSTAFPTETSVIEQIARGIITICDEVANGKIADPFDQRDPNIVESQFSGNSLTDFANNLVGAQSAYSLSLSSLVVAENPALDAEVKAAFGAAIARIREIPEPFLEAIQSSSNDGKIVAAQQAVREVQSLVEGQVLPLLLN